MGKRPIVALVGDFTGFAAGGWVQGVVGFTIDATGLPAAGFGRFLTVVTVPLVSMEVAGGLAYHSCYRFLMALA